MHCDLYLILSDHYELPYEVIEEKAEKVKQAFVEASGFENQTDGQDHVTNVGLTDDKPLLFFQLTSQLIAGLYAE